MHTARIVNEECLMNGTVFFSHLAFILVEITLQCTYTIYAQMLCTVEKGFKNLAGRSCDNSTSSEIKKEK